MGPIEVSNKQRPDLDRELMECKEKLALAVDYLDIYGKHHRGCVLAVSLVAPSVCTCGLDLARTKIGGRA